MLIEIIHKLASQFNENENQQYTPRPSLAGVDRCIRQLTYMAMKIHEDKRMDRIYAVFDDSKWHEELILDWLRKSAYQVSSEQMKVKIENLDFDFSINGSIDGILTDVMGKDYLLEIKAINHFTWQRYENGEIPNDYIAQVALYLNGAQNINPEIKDAILFVKNKNTSQYLEFFCTYNQQLDSLTVLFVKSTTGITKEINQEFPEIVLKCFEKFNAVKKHLKEKSLPKRQYSIEDWHCQYCQYNNLCYQDYRKEFAELKTDTMLPDEVADMLRYYKQTGAEKSESEKEYKALADKIKATMKDAGAREGKAGEFIVKLSLTETNRIDKELLTESERAKATVKSISERLYVSTPKIKEVVNGSI